MERNIFNSKFFLEFLRKFSDLNGQNIEGTTESCASFVEYLLQCTLDAKRGGNSSAAAKIQTTTARFKKFLEKNHLLQDGDFLFSDLTPEIMIFYEKELRREMLSPNTTSFYMRVLRSYYNKGIADGLYFPLCDPFKKVYTGTLKTKKRAADKNIITKLINTELPPKHHFFRDMFLFSFYTRGMSFIDIANLTSKNVTPQGIQYYRCKTGRLIRVRMEPCIYEIISRYSGISGGEYLFPILMKNGLPVNYNTSLKNFNNHLKSISRILKLDIHLTSYVARHSWATIAKRGGVPISTISEGMGHTSEKTTQIYLSSLEQETIDEANSYIIHSLNKRGEKAN